MLRFLSIVLLLSVVVSGLFFRSISTEQLERQARLLDQACAPQATMDSDNVKDNLALINIQKRLLIRFGPACRLNIESGETQGVEVSFVIPRKEAMP